MKYVNSLIGLFYLHNSLIIHLIAFHVIYLHELNNALRILKNFVLICFISIRSLFISKFAVLRVKVSGSGMGLNFHF